jgi:hypothetical protein
MKTIPQRVRKASAFVANGAEMVQREEELLVRARAIGRAIDDRVRELLDQRDERPGPLSKSGCRRIGDMGTCLRWWLDGTPQRKLPANSEEEAKNVILQEFPAAVFRWRAVAEDHVPANQHICAWANQQAMEANAEPIADILMGGHVLKNCASGRHGDSISG